MTENILYEQLARWLALKHPELKGLWHFDLSGVWTPSHKARNLYGRLNKRAWPDFTLPVARYMPGTTDLYHGLFIELKRDGTRIRKRDGSWASEHIAEQAEVLERLGGQGYCVLFCVGYDEATTAIDSYLGDLVEVPVERVA